MNKNGFVFIHAFIHLLENGCTARDSLELLHGEKNNNTISHTAGLILSDLRKGESIASAFIASSILPGNRYDPYILQFEKTGNILASLRLIFEDVRPPLLQSLQILGILTERP